MDNERIARKLVELAKEIEGFSRKGSVKTASVTERDLKEIEQIRRGIQDGMIEPEEVEYVIKKVNSVKSEKQARKVLEEVDRILRLPGIGVQEISAAELEGLEDYPDQYEIALMYIHYSDDSYNDTIVWNNLDKKMVVNTWLNEALQLARRYGK